MADVLLEIKGLEAWYGESHILHGVDLTVCEGEVVTLLGRNGAGRTTPLRAIMGLVGAREGSVRVGDRRRSALRRIALPAWGSAIVLRSAASSPRSRRWRTCCCRRGSMPRA